MNSLITGEVLQNEISRWRRRRMRMMMKRRLFFLNQNIRIRTRKMIERNAML